VSFALLSSFDLKLSLDGRSAPVCVIDARTREEYERGHIPGAVWIGWEDWCQQAPKHLGSVLAQPGYWGVFIEDPQRAAQMLSRSGVSSDKQIVVYADGMKSKGRDGRVAWSLLYLGAADVAILDGGWRGWLESGGQASTVAYEFDGGESESFRCQIQTQRRVQLDELKDLFLNGDMPLMIDTRSRSEFDGQCYDYMPRMGRMPNSVFMAYNSLYTPDGTFVSRDRYLSMLPPKVMDSQYAVAYCEVGVRAGCVALLHELYTGKVLPVYDGSLMEWSADPALPVT
jgi:thiosulfate/3-mercaptopyruvate sulfurtransferase